MSKETKFTEEELKKINEIKSVYDSLTVQLGQLEVEQLMLNEAKDILSTEYTKARSDEKKFAEELSTKYGEGQVNIETGVFVSE